MPNNPFEDALKNFKANKVLEESPVQEELIDDEAENEVPIPSQSEEISAIEEQEDEALYTELIRILGKPNVHPRVRKLIHDSRKHNVTFDMDRFFWSSGDNARVAEIKDFILKRGFRGDALSWLISSTPERMKYGTASKEERIQKAHESAERAGISLEELARANGISLS